VRARHDFHLDWNPFGKVEATGAVVDGSAAITGKENKRLRKIPRAFRNAPLAPEMDPAHVVPTMLNEDPLIAIYVRCQGLEGADLITKIDPRVRVTYDYEGLGGQPLRQIVKTDKMNNNKNPHFSKPLLVRYKQDTDVPLEFSVYEVDADAKNFRTRDTWKIGSFNISMASLLAQAGVVVSTQDKPEFQNSSTHVVSKTSLLQDDGQKLLKKSVTFLLCTNESGSMSLEDLPKDSEEIGCAAKVENPVGKCSLSGFEAWKQRHLLEMQIFAMDLANTDLMRKKFFKSVNIKAQKKAAIRGRVVNFGTDPYLQIYTSVSADAPCMLKNTSQFQWSSRKPKGTTDPNCRGPISIQSVGQQVVKGRSTEAGKNARRLSWNKFSVFVDELCGGDWDRMITLAVFDDDKQNSLVTKYKRDDLVGTISVPAKALRDTRSLLKLGNLTGGTVDYDFMNTFIGGNKSASRGLLMLNSTKQIERVTAASFVESGTNIEITFAIDFSQSNVLQPYGNLTQIMQGGLHMISDDPNNTRECSSAWRKRSEFTTAMES
jgi:hypothetical protein